MTSGSQPAENTHAQHVDRMYAIEQNALSRPTFPRLYGWNTTAAVLNWGELHSQYKDHCAALESVAVKDKFVMALCAIGGFGVAGVFAIMWLVGATNEASSTNVGSSFGWIMAFFISCFGFGPGGFIGILAATAMRYSAAYGKSIIVDKSRLRTEGKIVIGHTNLRRLGFVSRTSQKYFFGPTQQASVDKGVIVLEVAEGDKSITEMMVGELYQLGPGKGDLTGNAPSDTYAYIQMNNICGGMERRMNRKGLRHALSENMVYIVMAIAAILIFIQANSGFQIDPTNISLDSIGG